MQIPIDEIWNSFKRLASGDCSAADITPAIVAQLIEWNVLAKDINGIPPLTEYGKRFYQVAEFYNQPVPDSIGQLERNTKWRKHKESIQQELSEIMVELECLGLEQPAAEIRPLAISPENGFGSAGDWLGSILETAMKLSSAIEIPEELRSRLRQVVEEIKTQIRMI
jgi:hypothetical protein